METFTMKKNILILILVVFSVFVAAGLHAADQVWVSVESASLKADRGISAADVATLSKGTALTVLDYQKRWYRVKTPDGLDGWIYRGKITKTPPEKTDGNTGSGLGGLLGDLTGSSIEADTADSSRSIRGLSPEAAEYAKQTGTDAAYQKALDSVLDRKISDGEVEAFLKKGRIGEYAD